MRGTGVMEDHLGGRVAATQPRKRPGGPPSQRRRKGSDGEEDFTSKAQLGRGLALRAGWKGQEG